MITRVFLVSGFAALIYQVVWQRALFGIFGINIESVTIVVTAFLAGLGVGSMLGGFLSSNARRLILIFALAELSVGLYGLFSLALFRWVGSATLSFSLPVTALITLVLLLPPTVLMGMTLPLLVADGVKTSHSTGKTVGSLYFANTVGSAAAAIAAVTLILPLMGEQGSVTLAALLNLLAGSSVLILTRRRSGTS